MKLSSNKSVWAITVLFTTGACLVVSAVIMLLYPRDQWLWELSLSLALTIGLTVFITRTLAGLLQKNQALAKELQRLVDRDRLTDVATRDFFFERLHHDSEAYGMSLMIDIDHFKQVNDRYGHLAGDHVIKDVARVLRTEAREADIVCRFGGEEFVVFLHQADRSKGWEMAERMRAAIEAQVTTTDAGPLSVTVSVGGSLKDSLEDIDDAIRRADECLYEAKRAGRNRSIIEKSQATPNRTSDTKQNA